MEIDFGKFRRANSRVYSGRAEGYKVRDNLKLNELDLKSDMIKIKVPKDTLSLNTSFFLGVFGESVRTLGDNQFRNKYEFDCPSIVKRQIDDGITRALKTSNPLEKNE